MSWEDRDYSEPVGSFQRRWTLSWVLIFVSVGVFVFELAWRKLIFSTSNVGVFILDEFSLHPVVVVSKFHDWQILTHVLLDIHPISLLFNMLALFWFGNDLEELLGKKSYALVYFGGALATAFTFLVAGFLRWPGQRFTGPGGAILAMMVVAALTWPNRRVIVYVLPMPLKWAVLLFLGIDIYYAIDELGVASLSILAGAAWGFVFWKFRGRLEGLLDRWDDNAARRAERRGREVAVARSGEIDQILQKISQSGLGSLSDSERRILDEESRRKGAR